VRFRGPLLATRHSCTARTQALLRHQIPDGDLARIFDRALDALLREARRTKFAGATAGAAAPGRARVPPCGAGARSPQHRESDITLRCGAHNGHAARQDFGADHMTRFRRERDVHCYSLRGE
jgi:hypothetical protein